ncbi:2OG-Fe(II) oxygenase [Reichenbachiella carrageenanivorans]|uniref:2OG-Fe(II) oxygenase n=1 Tax=Reichenbachiella carrageenanivorans TaxID=2979869 RepID=A0ABY6D2S8_9BACT|nr:2OG-Fe(II) oxygenase [Reichenbachiella carrageenanivorans]UXX80472.1 2OG-Fe(II) oxygenase [Reichenbachiella carrageenanivorans]
MAYYQEGIWIDWVDALSEENCLVVDDFITDHELSIFLDYFQENLKEDDFKKAGIGTGSDFQLKSQVRGDYIRWLNREQDIALADFFERVDEAIARFNRYCFLSLSGSEFHMAHYPKGTFYKRHLDQFNQRSNRLISVILYLNKDWKSGDGGELKLYLDDHEKTVAPIAKRIVFMRSDQVEHEVLETHVDRYSLTGWLLYQPPGLTFLA